MYALTSPSTRVPSSRTPYASVATTSPVTVTDVASSQASAPTVMEPSTVAPASTQSAPAGTTRSPVMVWSPRSVVQSVEAACATVLPRATSPNAPTSAAGTE
ncbi:hypothetical protein [Cellulomonas sp. Y8]|uniref:hypothetical protein n=1 Tax=Cellulomonas sp. Y8 TaxID=2591145 RepID=UPI0011C838DD|nr:hypothetical protein [Cellulomonas sp. Y8]